MGIMDRFGRVVQASVRELLDQAEDPEQLLDHAIREMERELAGARQRLEESQSAARVSREMAEGRKAEATRFAERAQKARADGMEQAAREAESFEAKALAAAQKLAEQATEAEKPTSQLEEAVKALGTALKDTRVKQQELTAQLRQVRQARGTSAPRVGGARASDASEWRRVDQGPESGGPSWTAGERTPEQVEWELEQLHRRSAADEKLAELKKKMGKG